MRIEIKQGDIVDLPVGNIVATDIRKADVMKKYGIDFCCGGGKSLSTACADIGVDVDIVREELNMINSADLLPSQNQYFWDADFLCDYIEQTHHKYVYTACEYLLDYSNKVVRNHGKGHPELIDLSLLVGRLLDELSQHMVKEEHVLFPRIREMARAYREPENNVDEAIRGMKVEQPIQVMEHEHVETAKLLFMIRELTDNYTPPEDVCLTYKVYFAKLKEFDDDLTLHIHLENNLLFPKAEFLQSKFDMYQ